MYCMYVRVGLYSLDIILDIALIQHLPKLEKLTVLGSAVDEENGRKKKREIYVWSKQHRDIQHLDYVSSWISASPGTENSDN